MVRRRRSSMKVPAMMTVFDGNKPEKIIPNGFRNLKSHLAAAVTALKQQPY
jgi:hypothetical protein